MCRHPDVSNHKPTVMDRLHQAPTPLTIAGIASLQHEYYLAWVWPRATICEADVSGALKSAGGIGVPSTTIGLARLGWRAVLYLFSMERMFFLTCQPVLGHTTIVTI
jgi:hypothetical protein